MIKTILLFSSLIFSISISAQSSDAPSIKEIKHAFKYKNYSVKVLTDFRKKMDYEGAEYLIDEEVPGEIISFSVQPFSGSGSSKVTAMYKVINNKLEGLEYMPVNENAKVDKSFRKKVEKYAGKNWDFVGNSNYDVKKSKNGLYTISTIIKKEDEGNCCPSLYFEYSTKDFVHFIPERIREADAENPVKWIIIK